MRRQGKGQRKKRFFAGTILDASGDFSKRCGIRLSTAPSRGEHPVISGKLKEAARGSFPAGGAVVQELGQAGSQL